MIHREAVAKANAFVKLQGTHKQWCNFYTTKGIASAVKRRCNLSGTLCYGNEFGDGVMLSMYISESEITQLNSYLDDMEVTL